MEPETFLILILIVVLAWVFKPWTWQWKSSTDISDASGYVYAGFWRRSLAATIDIMLLLVIFLYATVHLQEYAFDKRLLLPLIVKNIIFIIIPIYLIVKFGATPGKYVLGLRIVDHQGNYLTTRKAIYRNWDSFVNVLLHSARIILRYFSSELGTPPMTG